MDWFDIIYDDGTNIYDLFDGVKDAISFGLNAGLRMGKYTMTILDHENKKVFECDI